MPTPRSRVTIIWIGLFTGLLLWGALAWLFMLRPHERAYFNPAPSGLVVQSLGPATNYLRLINPKHHWETFAVSNGTAKTMACWVTAVDQRTATGWVSNS